MIQFLDTLKETAKLQAFNENPDCNWENFGGYDEF